VVRRTGEDGKILAEQEVKQYLAIRLVKYKALDGGVKFVEAIAKTTTGKILKRILREDSRKDIEAGRLIPKL
jgi:acyl-coenzyme A synthetase/AMP-(fatty) acid ligase